MVSDLSSIEEIHVAHLLPSAVAELTQLFPIFHRLRVVQRLLRDSKPLAAAAQTRRRAEHGLRELIERVASERPLVLWIDDLQWGDLDSASVLRDWLQRPSSLPLLFVLSYRSDEIATSTCLSALLAPPTAADSQVAQVEIDLSPLQDADVEALCRERLGVDSPPAVVTRIVREAQGNAFLALQLAALAQARCARGEHDLDALSIAELVVRTSALLSTEARAILNVLAIAGRPMPPQLALSAAEVRRDGRAHIHALQGLRLVRSRMVGGRRLLEIYHDRVREAVQASFDSQQREELHARLRHVLEASGSADPDWLHELALGAAQRALAMRYGLLAAERAHSTLAFEREAELYARCLSLADDAGDTASLWSKLALALARCRRGAQAADAYIEAAARADAAERVPLLQLAASHCLRTGRFDEGERLVQQVLAAQHVEVPQSEAGLYAAIAWERIRLALRGTGFTPRSRAELDPEALRRPELYGTLAVETQFYAPLRAALFQTRCERLAFQLGEPIGIARALCMTAALSCLTGTARAAQRAEEQLARAEGLSREIDSHDLRSELWSARAVCAYLLGNMKGVVAASDEANQIHLTHRSGSEHGDYYYLFAVQSARMGALQILGQHAQVDAELRDFLARAEETTNRAAVLQVTLVTTIVEEALDRSARSRARLDRERAELPRHGIGILHILHLCAVMWAACGTGEFDWAFEVVNEYWRPFLKSPVRRSRVLASILHFTRARLLLNRYVALGRKGDAAALIRDDLRALESMGGLDLGRARLRLRARLAYLRGDSTQAARLLRDNCQVLTDMGFLDDAERDRHALGCVIGGEEGAQLRAAACASTRANGVANPLALMRAAYPELVIDAGSEHDRLCDSVVESDDGVTLDEDNVRARA